MGNFTVTTTNIADELGTRPITYNRNNVKIVLESKIVEISNENHSSDGIVIEESSRDFFMNDIAGLLNSGETEKVLYIYNTEILDLTNASDIEAVFNWIVRHSKYSIIAFRFGYPDGVENCELYLKDLRSILNRIGFKSLNFYCEFEFSEPFIYLNPMGSKIYRNALKLYTEWEYEKRDNLLQMKAEEIANSAVDTDKEKIRKLMFLIRSGSTYGLTMLDKFPQD